MIVALAAVSAGFVLTTAEDRRGTLAFWTFAKQHQLIYVDQVAAWNRTNIDTTVDLALVSMPVLEQRMMSNFLSGTPVADLLEVERRAVGRAFTGPLDRVGFLDLTDRLEAEGLLDGINAPSFSPWTSRGRVFGLPHDVHPTMLVYRADIVEAAGIDVTAIETWDDYFRLLRPLMKDLDGDGVCDRYLINLWYSQYDFLEALLLQAGGRMFDEHERLVIDTPLNAQVLARLVPWFVGPDRVARDANVISAASGQQIFVDGGVIGVLAPDWLSGLLMTQVPVLAGKLKIMPLPAWERGGRRTTVSGGTMLGIVKTSPHPEEAWAFAKALYLSWEAAEAIYRSNNIISPVKAHWSNPVYDEPSAYFCGQAPGRLYLSQAPHVPSRTSSPFSAIASNRVFQGLIELVDFAEGHRIYDPVALEPEARRHLQAAQAELTATISRNGFLAGQP